MQRTLSHQSRAKYLKRRKAFMSSVKGVSHLSRRAKRRLYCKMQLWMWRKRREQCRLGTVRGKRLASGISSSSCLNLKTQSRKNKTEVPPCHIPNREHSLVTPFVVAPPLGCDTGDPAPGRQNRLLAPHEPVGLPERCLALAPDPPQDPVTDTEAALGAVSQTMASAAVPSQRTETCAEFREIAEPSELSHTVKPPLNTEMETCEVTARLNKPSEGTVASAESLEVNGAAGQHIPISQDQATDRDPDEKITSNNKASSPQTDADLTALTNDIHEFLDDFYRIYGSFIPLQKSDVLRHLKTTFNTDFNDRKTLVLSEVTRYRTAMLQRPVPSFQVVYKKHTLTLDDLSTLADQNWLNDQVMNMYGELIMESAHHKVHFLNSFFHRQLMTKGYDGVKRWTKQVDLFSKILLLVPIHLEVHWCLVTADIVKKKIRLYDSQGNALLKVARNILKYVMTEAKEKQQTSFENGWTVSLDKDVPQQTNENDCGVFVLEYSRCLALAQPLQFSQKDIPKIRKRIYKELCDCKLHEHG